MYGSPSSPGSVLASLANSSFAFFSSSALSARSSVSRELPSSASATRVVYHCTKASLVTAPTLLGSNIATCSSNSSPVKPSPNSSDMASKDATGTDPVLFSSKVSNRLPARIASGEAGSGSHGSWEALSVGGSVSALSSYE